MLKYKKTDEYYLTRPIIIQATTDKNVGVVFDAGTPVMFTRTEGDGFIFTVRNMNVSVIVKESLADEYISQFDQEALRRAR